MDREKRRAIINPKHFVDNLISTYGITKTAITPATGDVMYVPEESKLLVDLINSGALRLSRTSGRLPYWTCLGLARRLGRIGTLANA